MSKQPTLFISLLILLFLGSITGCKDSDTQEKGPGDVTYNFQFFGYGELSVDRVNLTIRLQGERPKPFGHQMAVIDEGGIGIIVVRDGGKVLGGGTDEADETITLNGQQLFRSGPFSGSGFTLSIEEEGDEFCMLTEENGEQCFEKNTCFKMLVKIVSGQVFVWLPQGC